jgi:hypothetical protein
VRRAGGSLSPASRRAESIGEKVRALKVGIWIEKMMVAANCL